MQIREGPFDLDLVFAPDGIERFEDAWARRIEVEGFPVCALTCQLDAVITQVATSM